MLQSLASPPGYSQPSTQPPPTTPPPSPRRPPSPPAPAVGSSSSFAPLDAASWSALYLSSASLRDRACAWAYNWSLVCSLSLQLLLVVLFLAVDPYTLQTGYAMNAAMSALLVLLELSQLLFLVAAHVGMLRELVALYVRPVKVWNMYLSTVLAYAALYFSFFCFSRSSFNVDGYAPSAAPDPSLPSVPDQDVQTYNDVPTVFLFFVYFSAAIMTSTGFGDIAPSDWYTQFATNSQMLVGTTYHVGVFGLTLAHFRSFQRMSEEEKERQRRKAEQDPSVLTSVMSMVEKLQLAARIRNVHPGLDRFRKLCIRHLAIFSVVFQVLVTLLLLAVPGGSPFDALTPADGSRYVVKMLIISVMVLLQFLLFLVILLVSFRLVRGVNNADLTANFLVQSYVATALLFGGIYFILFAATPHHQFSREVDFSTSLFSVLYIFIHFSLTVLTTTGFGDIYARGAIARMVVLVEMLVSILYNAVIIGLGTSQLIDMQSAKAELEFSRLRLQAADSQSRAEEDEEQEGQGEEDDDDDMQLDDGDDDGGDDDEEDARDDADDGSAVRYNAAFDVSAAQRRRQQRRAEGGDHIQLTVLPPPTPPLQTARVRASVAAAQQPSDDADYSEGHMFGRGAVGDDDGDDDGSAAGEDDNDDIALEQRSSSSSAAVEDLGLAQSPSSRETEVAAVEETARP